MRGVIHRQVLEREIGISNHKKEIKHYICIEQQTKAYGYINRSTIHINTYKKAFRIILFTQKFGDFITQTRIWENAHAGRGLLVILSVGLRQTP